MRKITRIISAAVLFAGYILPVTLSSQNPLMLKDINAKLNGGSSTTPSDGIAVGSTYYFTGNSRPEGYELRKTDGTTAGTVIVKDIYPGGAGSYPYNYRLVGSAVFFLANDGTNGEQLWMSDGTSAGTKMVFDPDDFWYPSYLTVAGSYLFLKIYNDNLGKYAMYKVDAAGGVSLVISEYDSGANFPWADSFQNFTALGNTLFFSARVYDNNWNWLGKELLKTDGTQAGTYLVKDINPNGGYSYPQYMQSVGSTLLFWADNGTSGYELWKSDGTSSGTTMVSDLSAGSGHGLYNVYNYWSDKGFAVAGSNLFFVYSGSQGSEVWKSDGTSSGTGIVNDLNPSGNSDAYGLTAVGSNLFFSANDNTSWGLFKTDGTSSGTTVVSRETYSYGGVKDAIAVGNTLYFDGYGATGGYELWKSDGTSAGTALVKNINSGGSSSFPEYFGTNGTIVFFRAYEPTLGYEMFRSDGTSAGTYVMNLGESITQNSGAYGLTKVGNSFYFVADDGDNGQEIHVSDGTPSGTRLLKNIAPGASSINFLGMIEVGSGAYFVANDGVNGSEFWKTDGTSAGTTMIDLNPGPGGINAMGAGVIGSTLYFIADLTGGSGFGLYTTNGTTAGTTLIKDFSAGNYNGGNLIEFNGKLYFSVDDGSGTGNELWKSDGTSAGTVMVKDINAGGDSDPNHITILGSKLVFFANDGVKGEELWTSDGTDAGTQIVYDVNASSNFGGNIDPSGYNGNDRLAVLGSNVYFSAYTPSLGYELWKSDGTFNGTMVVNDLNPGSADSYPYRMTTAGPYVFFTTNWSNKSLYRTDGTSEGTIVVLKDANYPDNITSVGSLVFFRSDNNGIGNYGWELWISDGTAAGTSLVADIYGGTNNSSNPSNIINMNNEYIAFTAQDGFAGTEVWRYTSPAVINAASLGAAICAGKLYNVSYTVTQGILNSGNKFNVELSDGLGSFTNATVIGSLSGTAITGTIPSAIPAGISGLGYLIRVSSTDMSTISTLKGTPYIIANPPAAIWGKTTYCPGTPTLLTGTGGTSYSWSGAVSGTSNTISVETEGTFTVTATDAYGCTSGATVTIVKDATPTVTVTGATSYCLGESATLAASGATTYSWSPATGLNNANAAEVTVTGSGNQTYTVTGMGAACSGTATVNITVSTCGEGLGVNEDANTGIEVYPNPTNSVLNIKLQSTNAPATIKLVNTQGMLVYGTTAQPNTINTIDMSRHAKGIYWLQVTTDKGTTTNKIVVE